MPGEAEIAQDREALLDSIRIRVDALYLDQKIDIVLAVLNKVVTEEERQWIRERARPDEYLTAEAWGSSGPGCSSAACPKRPVKKVAVWGKPEKYGYVEL